MDLSQRPCRVTTPDADPVAVLAGLPWSRTGQERFRRRGPGR